MLGKLEWLIPDCYWPEVTTEGGHYVSHESICVLNPSDVDVTVSITLYFEDREPMMGFTAQCAARRTHHIRMDRLTNAAGEAVPRGVPYAATVMLDHPAVVQYSRCDTTQNAMAFMTAMAYHG